jgi:hypothetical protein
MRSLVFPRFAVGESSPVYTLGNDRPTGWLAQLGSSELHMKPASGKSIIILDFKAVEKERSAL